jgi:hypothetical protein
MSGQWLVVVGNERESGEQIWACFADRLQVSIHAVVSSFTIECQSRLCQNPQRKADFLIRIRPL